MAWSTNQAYRCRRPFQAKKAAFHQRGPPITTTAGIRGGLYPEMGWAETAGAGEETYVKGRSAPEETSNLGSYFGEQAVKRQSQPRQNQHRREIAHRRIDRKGKIQAVTAKREVVDHET
jgi:hypothetical protein